MDRSDNYIIAFDAGGTRLKTGVIDFNGKLLRSFHVPSRANEGGHFLLKTMMDTIEEIKRTNQGKLVGIGLSLSGVINPDKGVVLLPGKFKMLENMDLVSPLKERFKVPVIADNDGRLAAYAEKYFGLARQVNWAVVLTIGTGVGSGVIINGEILTNEFFAFGTQIGHLIIDKSNERLCLTGNNGTGEIFCSATALTVQVRDAIQRGLPSLLTDDYLKRPLDIDFKKIIDACRQNDALCLRELSIWCKNLSLLLINAVHSYSPQKIILGGGATLAADLFLPEVSRLVNETCFHYPKNEPVKIEISEMQEYGSVLGAAALLMKKLEVIK